MSTQATEPLYPALILDALRTVRYPGTGRDIVSQGLVADDIRINGRHVSFTLEFDKPNDPFRLSLQKAAEAAVHAHVGRDVEVEVALKSRPVTPQADLPPMLPGVKNIIGVASGKGGVGKSTVAVNLAVALARKGLKVGLLDADIFGPSLPKMLGVEGEQVYIHNVDGKDKIIPVEAHGVKMLSIGFLVDAAKPVLWRGAMAGNALKQLIGEADWGELDYFIIDMPPGTSDIHLTLVQSIPLTGVLIVTTPQEVALADARKGLAMFREDKIAVPVLGIVENMSWFTPESHPDERYHIFGRDGGLRLAEETATKLLGQVPLVAGIAEGGDAGKPVVEAGTPTAEAFALLADALVAETDERNRTLPPTRIVRTK